MTWTKPSPSELYHHGIKGQKWGKRNGPPYPLGSGQASASEKKAGWKESKFTGESKDTTKKKSWLERRREKKKDKEEKNVPVLFRNKQETMDDFNRYSQLEDRELKDWERFYKDQNNIEKSLRYHYTKKYKEEPKQEIEKKVKEGMNDLDRVDLGELFYDFQEIDEKAKRNFDDKWANGIKRNEIIEAIKELKKREKNIYIMNEQLVLIPNLEYKFTSSRDTMKNFYPRYEQYTIYKVKNV